MTVTCVYRHSRMESFPTPLQSDRGFPLGSPYSNRVAFSVTNQHRRLTNQSPHLWVSLGFSGSFQAIARFSQSKCLMAGWIRIFLSPPVLRLQAGNSLIFHQICAAFIKIILLLYPLFLVVSSRRFGKNNLPLLESGDQRHEYFYSFYYWFLILLHNCQRT